jgi:hypothetical protein
MGWPLWHTNFCFDPGSLHASRPPSTCTPHKPLLHMQVGNAPRWLAGLRRRLFRMDAVDASVHAVLSHRYYDVMVRYRSYVHLS